MSWKRIAGSNINKACISCKDTDVSLLAKFIGDNQIVSYRRDIGFGTTVLRFFQNGGRSCGKTYLQMKEIYGHPFIDHAMFYKTKEGKVIFTSQPCAKKEYILKQFYALFPSDFKIDVYDTEDSWYRPGEVTLFTIQLR